MRVEVDPGLSVLTSLLVSVDVRITEPYFGIGHNLSLIRQLTSEDIKHQFTTISLPSAGHENNIRSTKKADKCPSSVSHFHRLTVV